MLASKQMNIHISHSSFITYQNQMILCTRISPGKTLLSPSEILFLSQYCKFQDLLKYFKECSVITSSHMIFRELCYQLVLDMNANGKSVHAQCQFLLMTKEQLKHYCFEQKKPGTDGVALATISST